MRRGQHDFWRDQRAGAKVAARADDGDDGTGDALRRRRPAADDGVRRRCKEPQSCDYWNRKFHPAEIAVAAISAKRQFWLVRACIPC
jgi:hypothetical protein